MLINNSSFYKHSKKNKRMKNIIKLYVLIMLIFTGFVSCSDDDSDFVGKDHNIVSFSLENEGNTYIASISGNKIEIDDLNLTLELLIDEEKERGGK